MNNASIPVTSTEAVDRDHRVLRRPRITLTFIFIFAVCFSVWIPFSFNVGGLNLRASEALLPLVFLWLVTHQTNWRMARSNLPLTAAGFLLWGSFLFWTIVNLSSYTSPVGPLGRVFLLGLNLLHTAAIYWLVVRTQQWRGAVSALLVSVTFFNAFLIVVTMGSSVGIPFFQGLVAQEGGSAFIGGELVLTMVSRLKFAGVSSGVISASVLVIVMVILLTPKSKPAWWLWIIAVINVAGLVVGFSRQGVVSLVGGFGIIGLYLFLSNRLQNLIRFVILIPLILVVGFWFISQLPGGQGFFQAFVGRTLLLFQPDAYGAYTSVGVRLQMWSQMWADIVRNPLWGQGQDAYLKYFPYQGEGSHNFPLEVLHAAGIIGFLGYGVFHFLILARGWQMTFWRTASEADRYLLLGVLGAAVAVWLSSLTNLISTTPFYWVVLGLVWAGVRSLHTPVRQEKENNSYASIILDEGILSIRHP